MTNNFSFKRVTQLLKSDYRIERRSKAIGALIFIVGLVAVYTLMMMFEEGDRAYSFGVWRGCEIYGVIILYAVTLFKGYGEKLTPSTHYLLPASIPEKFVAKLFKLFVIYPIYITIIVLVAALGVKLLAESLFGYHDVGLWSVQLPENNLYVAYFAMATAAALFCSATFKHPVRMVAMFAAMFYIATVLLSFFLFRTSELMLTIDNILNSDYAYALYVVITATLFVLSYFSFKRRELY